MRIAFLVSGMYREFDFLAKSLEEQNLTKYDFYMSTWSSSNQKYKDSELYKKFVVTPNMITGCIPNCVYEILDELDGDETITSIGDLLNVHHEELNAIKDENERFNTFVEVNVKEQVLDLAKTSIVQNAWKNGQELTLHGWVYGLNDGYVTDLGVNFSCDKDLDDVYQLKF